MRYLIDRLKEINDILPDLMVLNIIYLIIGECIIFLFLPNSSFYGIGFLFGVLFSMFSSVYMGKSLDAAVYHEGNGAAKKMIIGYIIRIVVMAVILIGLYQTNVGDMFCAFLGMLALKVTAYIQPFTHKIFTKIL